MCVTGHGAPLPHNGVGPVPYNKQTRLQRNVADLARNGLTGIGMSGCARSIGYEHGMSSMTIGGDSSSPHGSFVNVGTTMPATATLSGSAGSLMTWNIGNSIGSIKGRLSRLGSLNFGRHGWDGHGDGRTHG